MPIAHIFSPNGMPWESRIGQETFFSHFWLSQECSKEMHCHDARCESQANKNVRTHNSTTITIIIIKEVDGVTQPTVCGVCVKMVAELSCRYCNMLLCYVNALRMLLQCLHRHRFRCLSHKHTAPPHCSACTETRHNDEGRPKSVLSVCISLSLSLFFVVHEFLVPASVDAERKRSAHQKVVDVGHVCVVVVVWSLWYLLHSIHTEIWWATAIPRYPSDELHWIHS